MPKDLENKSDPYEGEILYCEELSLIDLLNLYSRGRAKLKILPMSDRYFCAFEVECVRCKPCEGDFCSYGKRRTDDETD